MRILGREKYLNDPGLNCRIGKAMDVLGGGIKMNGQMKASLAAAKRCDTIINRELVDLLGGGFIENAGAYFLKSMYVRDRNVEVFDLPDKTGFECFVNLIHIDDYVEDDFLEQAILFSERVFFLWEKVVGKLKRVRVIVSKDDLSCALRFHLIRDGENWLSNDLEKYDESILLLERDDIAKIKALWKR